MRTPWAGPATRRGTSRAAAGLVAALVLVGGCSSADDDRTGTDEPPAGTGADDAPADPTGAGTSADPPGAEEDAVPDAPTDGSADDVVDEAALRDAATAHLEELGLDVDAFELEVRGPRADGTVEVRALHEGDVPEEGTLGGGSGESRALHLDPDTLEVVADLRFQ